MLMLTLLLVTVALFALFWGGTLIAQGYLYNQPVDRLPLRALGAAALVGSFLILWVMIDRRSPGKYDTFFNIEGEETSQFTEFEAVRWQAVRTGKQITYKNGPEGKPAEIISKVKRGVGTNAEFIDERTGKPFALSGVFPPDNAELTTIAIIIPDQDGNAVRYLATMDTNPNTGEMTYPRDVEARRFVREKDDDYVRPAQLGVVYVPRTVFWALALNLVHYFVWFAAFWLLLRFTWPHALLFTIIFGIVTMLLFMPLLFKPNRVPRPVEVAAISRQITHAPNEQSPDGHRSPV